MSSLATFFLFYSDRCVLTIVPFIYATSNFHFVIGVSLNLAFRRFLNWSWRWTWSSRQSRCFLAFVGLGDWCGMRSNSSKNVRRDKPRVDTRFLPIANACRSTSFADATLIPRWPQSKIEEPLSYMAISPPSHRRTCRRSICTGCGKFSRWQGLCWRCRNLALEVEFSFRLQPVVLFDSFVWPFPFVRGKKGGFFELNTFPHVDGWPGNCEP